MKIYDKLIDILKSNIDIDESIINLDSNLMIDLGMDSLTLVSLAADVESEFDIEIPDEEFDRIRTVKDVVEIVETLIK